MYSKRSPPTGPAGMELPYISMPTSWGMAPSTGISLLRRYSSIVSSAWGVTIRTILRCGSAVHNLGQWAQLLYGSLARTPSGQSCTHTPSSACSRGPETRLWQASRDNPSVPTSCRLTQQTLRLRTDLEQQMIFELRRQFRHTVGRRFHRAESFDLAVVTHPIFPGLQSAQLDFAFPACRRCEKCVVHFAVFRDRISLGLVVAGHIKVPELALRKHLLVIQTDPLLPALFFRSGQIDVLEFRTWIGPDELRAHDAPGSNRGGEIVSVFLPIFLYFCYRRKFDVIAIDRRFRPEQSFIHLDPAPRLHRPQRIGRHRLVDN